MELSVVIPCLDEADTLARCITKAQRAMATHDIDGEVVVADNGSTDGSQTIAASLGARVVPVRQRGYGHALRAGIRASSGRFVIMADADDSYDLLEIPTFVAELRNGRDLVQGCRLPSGGGRIAPGAMPLSHRWIGNPLLSSLARAWFRSPVRDVYCGMRGFRRDLFDRMDVGSGGMEFAPEMIIKAVALGASIGEVPITLHRDGRVTHRPHLRTVRDGWRTVRLFLLLSPEWLFLVPGAGLLAAGALGYALALPGETVFGATLGAHTLLVASLLLLVGQQAVLFAGMAKQQAVDEGLSRPTAPLARALRILTLERGLVAAAALIAAGIVLVGLAVVRWWQVKFGFLDYGHTMRLVVPGVTLVASGFQFAFVSFLRALFVPMDGA
jgi:hypothetical protein